MTVLDGFPTQHGLLPVAPTEPLRGDGVVLGGLRRLAETPLLPHGCDAPDVPALGVVFARVGGAAASCVVTRAARAGQLGWLPLAVRTQDPRVPAAARAAGVPATLADLGVERRGDGWRAWATRSGRPAEVLDELAWRPGEPDDDELAVLAQRLVGFRDPLFLPGGRLDVGLVAPGGVKPRSGRVDDGTGALFEGPLEMTFRMQRSSSVALLTRACHARRAVAVGRRAARRRR